MTRKDVELIASGFAHAKWEIDPNDTPEANSARQALYRAASTICGKLYDANSRFDHRRFMQSCGFRA